MNKVIERFIWNFLNPVLLKLTKRKRYFWQLKHIGLNLGCGIDNPTNWLGIDGGITHIFAKRMPLFLLKIVFYKFKMSKKYTAQEYYKKLKSFDLIYHDLRFGIPFADNTVPNIYSSHFFEHLSRNESKALLADCYRVLKPNGMIRICVPDIRNDIGLIEKALNEANLGNILPIQKYIVSDETKNRSKFSFHRYMFDSNDLMELIKEVGFSNIKPEMFKKGEMPDVKILDTREGIFVEGKKN